MKDVMPHVKDEEVPEDDNGTPVADPGWAVGLKEEHPRQPEDDEAGELGGEG